MTETADNPMTHPDFEATPKGERPEAYGEDEQILDHLRRNDVPKDVPEPQFPDPGVYYGVPEDVYHACKHMSQSRLKVIDSCPAKDAERQKYPPTSTDAQLEGTATHYCILQPELYDKKVVARPKLDKRGKANQEQQLAWELEAQADGKLLIDETVETRICRMRDAVHMHPEAKGLFGDGKCETTIVFDESAVLSPVRCKLRLDYIPQGTNIIVDLKTTRCSHPAVFLRDVVKFGYHVQAAFYRRGYHRMVAKPHDYLIIAVEKTAPYPVTIFRITPELRQAGEDIWRRGMRKYLDCTKTGRWPGYTDELVDLERPEWLERMEDNGDDENGGFF